MFLIMQERPAAQGMGWLPYKASFPTVAAAERRARTWTEKHRQPTHIFSGQAGDCDPIAEVILDPLDRVWTEVTIEGGRFL